MHFPLFLDLSEKEILVIGAGHIAFRRVRSLCGFAGHITIVSPQFSEDFYTSGLISSDKNSVNLSNTKISAVVRCFETCDLEGKDVVLAATDNTSLNRHIFDLCQERCIPVNVCSDLNLCDFQFPSIVESGAVVIGINASGQDHYLVKETRKRVETFVRDEQFKSKYE